MGERTLFPNASTKDTLAYCWRQMRPDRAAFTGACTAIVLGTLANAVAAPLIFAALLGRIAQLGPHSHEGLWQSFGALLVAYAIVLAAATLFGRIGGWVNWGATLRSFARAITGGYDHLMSLSHSWHTDRPSGEVIATLETSTWAFADMIDATVWGILRISVTTIGAIVVLGVVAWPVALVMAGLVSVFVVVLHRRMGRVVAAEKQFSDAHSRATGVIADTIANLTTVRSQAAEEREMDHVEALVADSISADLRARKVFTATRIQMESAMAFFNWAAIVVGVVLALHHVAAAGAVYLILFYATFVGTSLEESFEFIRLISRAIGRCAKFAGIAATEPDIVDLPGAPDMVVPHGRVEFKGLRFAYRGGAPLFDGLDLRIEPGEHVGLVGPSGSGKTTLTKLLLRFADRDGGLIEIDGQDIACVTQHTLRGHIAYVPQDPQMLHRTIAENICYGMDGVAGPAPGAGAAAAGKGADMDLVRAVGRAAYVDEFVERLPDGYQTMVGERGMKLSGGQRQRVAIAQAMAKGAKVLLLDEATSALDSESESLVQEALWRLMEGTTALVVAHRLATIARLDRIVVLDRGHVVEQGTHAELLSAGRNGVYGRLWAHQSGGFLAA
ncbi:MAG TPA: ABC transporter ATP-binding protein [Acidimicrobiales bacterium]|jgi:ATP-binding cassette subfamily B protein|nr:ABC transporter ATP-binding protein [Acidimicrobiales bacterium]